MTTDITLHLDGEPIEVRSRIGVDLGCSLTIQADIRSVNLYFGSTLEFLGLATQVYESALKLRAAELEAVQETIPAGAPPF